MAKCSSLCSTHPRLGRVTGARKSEWYQDSQTVQLTSPNIFNVPQQPLAFIFSDFPFLDHQHRLILAITPDTITPLTSVTKEWRFQETNTNCEKIPFARVSKRPPPFCPILAALRIVQCNSTSRKMHLWQSTTVHPHQPNTKSPLSYTASAQVTAYLHKHPSASRIRTLLCSRNGPVIPFE